MYKNDFMSDDVYFLRLCYIRVLHRHRLSELENYLFESERNASNGVKNCPFTYFVISKIVSEKRQIIRCSLHD